MAVIDIKLLSHGTVPCYDLEYTIELLQKLFGFEVARTSAVSASFRLGGTFCFSALQKYDKPIDKIDSSKLDHHFGLDLDTEVEVDAAYKKIQEYVEYFKLKKITAPCYGHGTYYFYIIDADSNYWEVLRNPKDGYRYRFEQETDLRLFTEQDNNSQADKQKNWEKTNASN